MAGVEKTYRALPVSPWRDNSRLLGRPFTKKLTATHLTNSRAEGIGINMAVQNWIFSKPCYVSERRFVPVRLRDLFC
jgi:hypothetical protein